MVGVLMTSVNVVTVGMASFATPSSAIQDATNMVNAKTEHAYASPDGTESIVHLKVVPEGKLEIT